MLLTAAVLPVGDRDPIDQTLLSQVHVPVGVLLVVGAGTGLTGPVTVSVTVHGQRRLSIPSVNAGLSGKLSLGNISYKRDITRNSDSGELECDETARFNE